MTGVTLKPDFPVGDPKQKISLMAASDEYPDLIFASNNANIIVDAGGLIDLAPLIDKYGPNIKKLYGDYLKRLRGARMISLSISWVPTASISSNGNRSTAFSFSIAS